MWGAKSWGALAAVVLLAAFAINIVWAPTDLYRIWLVTLAAVCVSLALIGLAGGRWESTFIDNRNRMSLSKLQVVLWTIVVFASLVSASCFNIEHAADPSNITAVVVDPKIWALLGISLTTAVGAPIALSAKGSRTALPAELDETKENLLAQTGVAVTDIGNRGHVLTKVELKDARWSDLIRGDDVGNADLIDFSKVQQLYFTLLTLLIFAFGVAKEFSAQTDLHADPHAVIPQLPTPDSGMLALLAVSGAGYLVYKGMSHSEDG
jgi:hypothetical protein